MQKAELSLPDIPKARLKKALQMKGLVTAMEAHSGITGLIVEKQRFMKMAIQNSLMLCGYRHYVTVLLKR